MLWFVKNYYLCANLYEIILTMSIKEFFSKFVSRFVMWHLLAMVLVIVALCFGVSYSLQVYTHHGEGIEIPDLYGMDCDDAADMLKKQGILVVINDTGYNKKMDADCILAQTPGAGTKVKEGRTVYLTINSTSSPRVKIPDIIDNSSYREAQARLSAIGFTLVEPKVIDGERDWVYGVMAGAKNLQSGDMVSIETPLMLVIGNGKAVIENSEDALLDTLDTTDGGVEKDEFEEIVGVE